MKEADKMITAKQAIGTWAYDNSEIIISALLAKGKFEAAAEFVTRISIYHDATDDFVSSLNKED